MGRYGKGLLVLFVGIVLFSIAGLTSVAAVLAPPVMIGIVLFGLVPSVRPGAQTSIGKGRKAHRISYFGHYHDPVDLIGRAILMMLAVGEIAELFQTPYGLWGRIAVFGVTVLVGRLSESMAEIGQEVVSVVAVVAIIARILLLAPGEAMVSKVLFGVAVLITGVVLLGAWNLPRTPFLMFAKGPKPRLLASFALLELAATLTFPVGVAAEGSALDLWAGPDVEVIHWVAAIFFFTIVTVLTAYGPRFVTGLLGISLALVHFYFLGFDYLILFG